MEGLSEERCTLVGELVQVLEMARKLDGYMAGQLGGGGEERCRALVATMRASIDRSVHIAMSFCGAENAEHLPVFGGQPESPPSGGCGGDGSPRSAGSDQAGDSRGRRNAGGPCKKRKTLPKWTTQVRVSAVQDMTPLDDGLSWRKYGQKDILGAKYPRAYFRCTYRHTQGCHANKHVQRTDGDPLLFDVVYHGNHTCAQAPPAAAHPSNLATPPATSAENENSPPQPQPQPGLGLEQATASPVLERNVLQRFLPPSNNNPAAGANENGFETSGGFPAGSIAVASTFMSPPAAQATLESQPVNAPAVELASATNSPMGDMYFIFPLDDAADFLETDYF